MQSDLVLKTFVTFKNANSLNRLTSQKIFQIIIIKKKVVFLSLVCM